MSQIPQSLEETITQAKQATITALEAGNYRIQIELVIPEIALQAQAIALQFTSLFAEYGSGLKVLFPDTGAAALARRDWGEIPFKVTDLGSSRTPIDTKITPDDQIFLVVCPSSVEVNQVEKLCNLAQDRPVIILIPQLEDVAIVGIGYAARQLRERFLSTIVSAYYIRPLEGAIVYRTFPETWQVWLEVADDYQLIAEETQKPMGEYLERLLFQATNPQETENIPTNQPTPKKANILRKMQSFLQALSQ
jgi:hypothetical protein